MVFGWYATIVIVVDVVVGVVVCGAGGGLLAANWCVLGGMVVGVCISFCS